MTDTVRDGSIDIVHAHNPPTCIWAGLILARKLGCPFVCEIHRLTFDSFADGRRHNWPAWWDEAIGSLIRRQLKEPFKVANAIVAQTKMHHKRLLEVMDIEKDRIHVIPMGVDNRLFAPDRWRQEGQKIRTKKGWQDKVVFMYNGFLDETNGIHLFLQALLQMPRDLHGRMRAVILGRGPLADSVKQHARLSSGLIQYLGLVDYYRVPAYYAACDVVVVPVLRTRVWDANNPTKMMEGMAMEKVVLGSHVRGVTDVLDNEQTGLTFCPDDICDLQRQMFRLTNNIKSFRHLGRAARQIVSQRRCWSRSRKALKRVYHEVRNQRVGEYS